MSRSKRIRPSISALSAILSPTLIVLNAASDALPSHVVPEAASDATEVNAVCTNGDLYAISVDKRIFIYRGSTLTDDISVDEDILRMGFISGDKLCVVSSGGVHTVN